MSISWFVHFLSIDSARLTDYAASGWQFEAETGKCVHVPYSARIPEVARVCAWPVLETNAMILFYYGGPDRLDPEWLPLSVDGINQHRFSTHGYSEHRVRAHIQEMPENGADVAHLKFLHIPFVIESLPGFNHQWDADWQPGDGDQRHFAFIDLKQSITFMGHRIPGTFVPVTINQMGPGLVYLHLTTALGTVVVFETVTPIGPLLQKATHQIWTQRTVPRFVAKLMLSAFLVQFEVGLLCFRFASDSDGFGV